MSSPPATAENRDEVRSDFLDVYKTLLADKTLLASLTNENGREVQAAASGMLTTLDKLAYILQRMARFEPGGWDLDHVADLTLWLPSFKHLGPSKKLFALASEIRDLSYTLSQRLYAPFDPADLSEDEEPPAPLPSATSTETQAIRVTRSGGVPPPQDEVAVVPNPIPCDACKKSKKACEKKATALPGGRCISCNDRHVRCSLVPPKKTGAADDQGSSSRSQAAAHDEPTGSSSSAPLANRSKSPVSILSTLANKLSRHSDSAKNKPAAPSDSSSTREPRSSRHKTTHIMSIPLPYSKPISSFSSPVDLTRSPPASLYSASELVPSSSSLLAPSTTSSFLVPGTHEYDLEMGRLQIEYKRSQDSLRSLGEYAEAQKKLYEQALQGREAAHRRELEEKTAELEDLRRQVSSSKAAGKRRM